MLVTYTTNSYPTEYVPTAFDNYSANTIIEGRPWVLGLWDTAGQDDYDRLRPLSYPDTDCFVVTFSIDSSKTLQNIKEKWYPEIHHHGPSTPFILVGTKLDLRNDVEYHAKHAQNFVTYDQGKALAAKLGAAAYVECSAKNYVGVKEVFDNVIHAVLEQNSKKKNCVIQ